MMYRDDQEALLARLDALEADHAKVLAENAQLRSALLRASQRPTNPYVFGRDAQVAALPAAAIETPAPARITGGELATVSLIGVIAAVLVVLVAIAIASP